MSSQSEARLTQYEGEGVLAQVEPVQAGGAGGRGQGQEAAVGDHGHLVTPTGQEVSQAD